MSFDDFAGAGPLEYPEASLTTGQAAAQLTRGGYSWGPLGQAQTVTFAFRATDSTYDNEADGFSQFSAQQIQASLLAFKAWSDVANITFNRVGSGDSGAGAYSNTAKILLGNYSSGADGAAAFAYMAGGSSAQAGDVWVNSTLDYNADPTLWDYGVLVLVHELGHAIGLDHPADYDALGGGDPTYTVDAIYVEDTLQYSVMSYFSETNTGADYDGAYAAAPLMHDIAAAQRLYGANYSTRAGDTVYGFHSNADRPWYALDSATDTAIFCVWDGGGRDTLDFSGYRGYQFIRLTAESFSSVGGLDANISIAKGVVIENAIGGDDGATITGNAANNRLTGGKGDDRLSGLDGDDTLVGGGGSDHYDGGGGIDTVSFMSSNVGLYLRLSYGPSGGQLHNLENVTGTRFADTFYAGEGTLRLVGGEGDDRFMGLFAGETIKGGAGNDELSFEESVDGVTFDLASLTDASIENLAGSAKDDLLVGDVKANLIRGLAGADTLIGGGGADTLDGGENADTVSFANAAGGVTVDLIAGTAIGPGRDAIVLLNIESLIGSDFADVITAPGSHGPLVGGGGDDVFLLDRTPGQNREVAGGAGRDTVSYALSSGPVAASLDGSLGDQTSGIENLAGSRFNDVLRGDGGDNRLAGANGADTLSGGMGADTFVGGGGIDTIDFSAAAAGVSADLGRGRASGEGDDRIKSAENLIGSAWADRLTGGLGDNALSGGGGGDWIAGGAGADRLNGGAGNDVFAYGRVADSTAAAYDTIKDLQAGDVIDLGRIDADPSVRGNQAFEVVDKFTAGDGGQLVIRYDAARDVTRFMLDVDGDRVADMVIAADGDQTAFGGLVL